MPHDNSRAEQSAGPGPSALRHALRCLLRRQLSVSALTTTLEKEGFTQESIEFALAECRAMGYLNDGRLADAWAHTAQRRGKGSAWLRAKLARDGIPAALTQVAVSERRKSEEEAASALIAKRFGPLPTDHSGEAKKKRARAARFLASRGFAAGAVSAAISGVEMFLTQDTYPND